MHVSFSHAFMQQLPHSTLELWADLLWLVADIQSRHARGLGSSFVPRVLRRLLLVALQQTSHHANEGGLARAVLSEHHDDLGVGEGPGLHVENELSVAGLGAHGLGHVWVVVQGVRPITLDQVISSLRNLECQGILSEPQVLRRYISRQEDVDAFPSAEGHGDDPVGGGHAVEAADVVRQVVQHSQIVLHHQHVAADPTIPFYEGADGEGGPEPLLHVQVRGGLVEHVHVRLLHHHHANGKPLQLPARQNLHLPVQEMHQLHFLQSFLHHVPLALALHDDLHFPLHGTRDVVHVLGLDDRLQVVLQDAREVVLQLRAPEVGEDLLPVRGAVEPAQVGLELARQDLEGRGLADAVCPHQAQHLARPWHWKAMELEGVWSIAMRSVLFQVFGQVDDVNSFKRAFLHANTATNAKLL
mmetsp:Transcript_16711/g.24544  ORF Transcript_16711/g.24544 Transcript_16711/m.24544 type:complete len:414 (-) Transcript_16711:112-1353(-)